tara:strand:+ start:738 stop:1043 length:306 start_codon:yes stop_codon:yes gene_type:complete
MTRLKEPWTFEHRNDGYGDPYISRIISSDRNKKGERLAVCSFVRQKFAPYKEANARLIAAAPDMLAALEAVCEFIDFGTPVRPGALIVDDIKAAIAKARGE